MKNSEMNIEDKGCGLLSKKFKDLWNEGCFDDYSNSHFVIRSLNDDETLANEIADYSKTLPYGTFNPSTFIINFSNRIQQLFDLFPKQEKSIKDFVSNQLAAGKARYQLNAFIDAFSEILLINFLGSIGGPKGENLYEPQQVAGLKTNPEASFTYPNGKTLNVEVKHASFSGQHTNTKFIVPLLPMSLEKINEFKGVCESSGYEMIAPRVNKIKDFFNSACKKFNEPLNDDVYNILVINWTDTDLPSLSVVEPFVYLNNDYNGLLKFESMAGKLSQGNFIFDNDAYKKISAVIIFKSSVETLLFSDFRYMYANPRHVKVVMNPFILDSKQKKDTFLNTIQFTGFDEPCNSVISVPFPKTEEDSACIKSFEGFVTNNYLRP